MKILKKKILKILNKGYSYKGIKKSWCQLINDRLQKAEEAVNLNENIVVMNHVMFSVLQVEQAPEEVTSVINKIQAELFKTVKEYNKKFPIVCSGCGTRKFTPRLFFSKREVIYLCDRCALKRTFGVKSSKLYQIELDKRLAEITRDAVAVPKVTA